MASKMASRFRRSVSFSYPIPPKKTYHIRSISFPCRTHPIISDLRDKISDLQSWSADADRTSAWLCDGLRHLISVHASLYKLLHLPQTRESFRGSDLLEKYLEDLLRFVDAYGTFQTLAIRLREEHSAAQSAVRKKDDSRIAARLKNMKVIAKEIGRLAAVGFVPVWKPTAGDEEAEMIEVMNDVLKVTARVSGQVFGRLSSSSAFRKTAGCGFGAKLGIPKVGRGIRDLEMDLGNMRERGEEDVKMAAKKMWEMEDRMREIQECGEKAFRRLIKTRVSLLNLVTQ